MQEDEESLAVKLRPCGLGDTLKFWIALPNVRHATRLSGLGGCRPWLA
jgi:hypothetical protein